MMLFHNLHKTEKKKDKGTIKLIDRSIFWINYEKAVMKCLNFFVNAFGNYFNSFNSYQFISQSSIWLENYYIGVLS